MCGRYALTSSADILTALFGLGDCPPLAPRYNVAPTQDAPIVRWDPDRSPHLQLARWGLVPHWADDPGIGSRMINARSETVEEKPAFRDAFATRRCLVPIDGFYEWQRRTGGKQPYYIRAREGAPLALAGLWERWRPAEPDTLDTYTILTCPPCAEVGPIGVEPNERTAFECDRCIGDD